MTPFLLALAFCSPAVAPGAGPGRPVTAADVPGDFVVNSGGADWHFTCLPGGAYWSPWGAGWRGCWRVRAGELQVAEWPAGLPAGRPYYLRVPLRRSPAGHLERRGLRCEGMRSWDLRPP